MDGLAFTNACEVGLHKWGKWDLVEALDTLFWGRYHRQMRRCEDCGVRETRRV
jgi:hypothetical protein